jgi:SAM-dependent methyltransferase
MIVSREAYGDEMFLTVDGECPICEKPVIFTARGANLRDSFECPSCRSIPRERALFLVLKTLYPSWRTLYIHESSPIRRGASERLRKECKNYSFSQYDPTIPAGSIHPEQKHRSEDLEHLTFADETFDIVITQDVFEHIFQPALAAKEIARVIRPGGAHIMTTPLVRQNKPSQRRCKLGNHHEIINFLEPVYHGNPMSKDGSIVTVDWGFDILPYLAKYSGTPTMLFHYYDLARGLGGPLMEVIVSPKLVVPDL